MAGVEVPPPFFCSMRFVVTIMAFFGYCLQYMLKINLGIAIVCMVNYTALEEMKPVSNSTFQLTDLTNSSNDEVQCLFKESKVDAKDDGEFIWTKATQGFVLASYFYGYIITQVPGGWLAAKYGGTKVIVVSNVIASILTIISPFFARSSYIALSLVRFFIGLAHGAFWPAMSAIFVYWSPKADRTKMVGSSTSGAWFGNIIALPLGGFLCIYGFDGGWASIFYIMGILGLIWSIVFMIVISDSPKTHWFISEREQTYIVESTIKETSARERGPLKTPWKEIFLSKVCWATFLAHFANNWGNYMFLTQLPSFMRDVLKFDIKSNGAMSAIPYIACAIVTITFGAVSDKIIRAQLVNRSNARKIYTGIGLYGPMIGMICLSFVDCSIPYVGVACLTFGIALNGFFWCGGPLVNVNDIAGSFSSVVFGIANTFGTAPGIIAPYFVGLITKNQLQEEWRIVFIVAAIVYFLGGTLFVIFGNSNLQSWAHVSTPSADDKELEHLNKNDQNA